MPVHNALPYLDAAVESILGQTFADFEFVILDDASTDGSTKRLREWAAADSRIRLTEVKSNLGPVGSSNRVAREATAPIVARMDADDISYPDRLAAQLQLLREHADVGLVASVSDMIDASGRKTRQAEVWRLSRPSVFVPFAHGAMMYRRRLFEDVGGYRPECEFWEDQDLVVRMAAISKVLVIPRPLYRVRQSTTSTRVGSNQDRLERALEQAYRATDRLQQGRGYEDVLASPQSGKLDPRVFIALGSVRLWAGERPRLLRRMLLQGRLSFDRWTAAALIWTAWASVHPSSLRAFLLFLLRNRNRVAFRMTAPIPWQPVGEAGVLRQRSALASAPPRDAGLMGAGKANRGSGKFRGDGRDVE